MIVIGTSGYHFPDWKEVFYPPKLPKHRWLEFYSTQFQAVEINSTYYGIPKAASVAKWVEQTPENFIFLLKVHSDTTHKRQNQCREVSELLERLEPLHTAGKFGGLLAQFPASFHRNREAETYLEFLAKTTVGNPIFVEFRHGSWDQDGSIDLCRRLGIGWVTVDQPLLPNLMRPRPAVVGKIGYVRFHGRNTTTWYNSQAGDRYDWNYSDSELSEWLPRLAAMDNRAEVTYLFFNNCHAGQAIKNALRMREMLLNQFEVF